MIPPSRRTIIVQKFIRIGRSLEQVLPGENPRAESEMASLVSKSDRDLLEIAATASDDVELQLANWLRDLASLPAGSTIRRELLWIRIRLNLLPRPRGSFVLDAPAYPIPEDTVTREA
jgi:hypothetical protein